jgi:hypothetical protein
VAFRESRESLVGFGFDFGNQFGRVGSFVIENRGVTTELAEERIERQAREFELLKPYLVSRWSEPA